MSKTSPRITERGIEPRIRLLRGEGHGYETLPAAYEAKFGRNLRADLSAAFYNLNDKERSRRWPGGEKQYVENSLVSMGR